MKDDYWMKRRTIRRYDSTRPVDKGLLKDLLEKAAHAPTTGNMQLYSVVITQDKEIIRQLTSAHFGQPQVIGAGAVLTFCADFNRFTQWCKQREANPAFDNFQSFMAAVLDTVALAQQFNTLAEKAGLGVCWLGTTTYNAPEIAAVLALPSLVVPVITLSVGWPAEEGEDVGRLPKEAFIHDETYHLYTSETIDLLYQEKEERADSRGFVEENGQSNLAQVFTEVRYPKDNNEAFSAKVLDYLKKTGFLG